MAVLGGPELTALRAHDADLVQLPPEFEVCTPIAATVEVRPAPPPPCRAKRGCDQRARR
jgi:hypothetical protein